MTSPIYFVNTCEKHLFDQAGDRLPLGLLYLSSFAKSKGFQTKIWDLNHKNKDDMIKTGIKDKVKYWCFGTNTPTFSKTIELAEEVRANLKHAVLIAGGNHVTDNPMEAEARIVFDYLIVGDGENALMDILNDEASEQILYSKPVEDLDSLPMPDYEGVDMTKYTMHVDGKPGTLIMTSRGCKWNCCYCGSASSLNNNKMKKYRERSAKNVIEEIKTLYHKYGKKGFYFGDDIFTFNKDRVIDICCQIHDNELDITWRATTRSDLLDDEILAFMKSAGCNIICLGLESGNDEILKKMQKGTTVAKQRASVELCHKHGIKVKGFFIFPLPFEDENTFKDTLEFAKSLNLEYADIYPLTPYPGTQVWDNPEKYGIEVIKPQNANWDTYYQVGKGGQSFYNIKHPNFTEERVFELIKKFRDEVKVGGLTYK